MDTRQLTQRRDNCRRYVAVARNTFIDVRIGIAKGRDRYTVDDYAAALDMLDTAYRRLNYAQTLLAQAERALEEHLSKELCS